ncbi:hypothetical protein V2A60_008524 [Cordyceps javanica]
MPVARNTPLEKRRVKTGCAACRQRRRKCDEKKPQCTNCEARRVACKYANSPDPRSGTYAEITFVNEKGPPASASPDPEPRRAECAKESPQSRVSWQLPTSQPAKYHHAAPATWESYFETALPEPFQREIALLRQFRYRTAPWLEAGEPDSRFAVALMHMAREHALIQTLIVQLASSHLHQTADGTQLREVRAQLSNVAPDLRLVADALINLAETLCTGPRGWKRFQFHLGPLGRTEEPLKTLVHQQSRIDLAASILTKTPPSTDSNFYLVQHNLMSKGDSTPSAAYNWALHHLTACLHFVFQPIAASQDTVRASPGSPDAFAKSVSPTDWLSLWLGTQAWYDARPIEILSLVDVGSIEMGRIDPTNAAAFPIHLYSSALAVQAATFYHIAALLLLQHKPRLLNIPDRRQHLTSTNWHVRAIAGIATSNEFLEQWDPIVIASVLYVANNITHAAQQHTILELFSIITSQAGISLDDEAVQLRAKWAAASLVESPVYR